MWTSVFVLGPCLIHRRIWSSWALVQRALRAVLVGREAGVGCGQEACGCTPAVSCLGLSPPSCFSPFHHLPPSPPQPMSVILYSGPHTPTSKPPAQTESKIPAGLPALAWEDQHEDQHGAAPARMQECQLPWDTCHSRG